MTTDKLKAQRAMHGLKRELGFGSATAAVAGEVIAVGIFLTPAGMAKAVGSPMWLLIVWVVVGAMTLSGALCYGELAGRFPRAGGTYVFLWECFGARIAFLFGWMSLLVMEPGLTAAFATGLAGYAAYIFHWSRLGIKVGAVAAIWGLCILNMVSTKISAGFLRWVTWLKFAVLGTLVIWAIARRLGTWSNFVPFVAQRQGALPLAPALGIAIVSAFFSFGGWWDATKIAGEVRDPAKTLPRALALGVVSVTVIYVLVSGVFWYLIPFEKVTSDEAFVAKAGAVLFGPAGGIVFSAIVVTCVLGSLAAVIMSSPRVYYAMAKDGLFIPAVAKTHPRFGTPARAVAVQGILASVLVALGSFEEIVSYFIFVAVAFIGLAVAGLFVLRRRQQPLEGAMATPGYPVTPLAFLLLSVVMLVLLALHSPRQALLGSAVVLAGVPVFQWMKDGMMQRSPAD
ncbi:MAG: amino acid permease [Candidatus Acidiferrales bacterium]